MLLIRGGLIHNAIDPEPFVGDILVDGGKIVKIAPHIDAPDAEIYDAKVRDGMYAPLFDCLTFKPRKAYYTYLMFNELRKLGKAVALPKTDEGIYLCGAADGNGKAALMVSNISGKSWKMDFSFGKYKVTEVRLLDDGHLNDTIDSVPGFLGNWSVCLLLLEKGMTPTSAGL